MKTKTLWPLLQEAPLERRRQTAVGVFFPYWFVKRTDKQAVQNNLIYSVWQTQNLAEKNRSSGCMPSYNEKAQGTAVLLVFSMTFTELFCFSVSQVHAWEGVAGINRGEWKQRGGELPSSSRRHWKGCTNPYRLPSVALPIGFHHFPFTIVGHHFLEQNECITLFPL